MSNYLKKATNMYKDLSAKNLPKGEIAKIIGKELAENGFSEMMINYTKKYQEKYGFDSREGDKEFSTHNNEADAFKHTFMQAWLTAYFGAKLAKKLGDMHENDGKDRNQPSGEENMDLWNNNQGREIGEEIWKTFSRENGYNFVTKPYNEFNDIIAEKVMQRMKAGKLITHPNDTRRYNPKTKSGSTTGQAAPISSLNSRSQTHSKAEQPKTQSQNFSDTIRQKYKSQQSESNKKFDKIFKSKSTNKNNGKGRWVTMNGAHIFIED